MAAEVGLNQTAVHRIWKAFGLQPHRQDAWKLSRTRSSSRRSATSSASTSIRPSARWCSASTRRARSRRSTGPRRSCRCCPGVPEAHTVILGGDLLDEPLVREDKALELHDTVTAKLNQLAVGVHPVVELVRLVTLALIDRAAHGIDAELRATEVATLPRILPRQLARERPRAMRPPAERHGPLLNGCRSAPLAHRVKRRRVLQLEPALANIIRICHVNTPRTRNAQPNAASSTA